MAQTIAPGIEDRDLARISHDCPEAAALLAQSACNPSGLILGLERARQQLTARPEWREQGTEWLARHPVVRLFLEQLAHLNGCAIAGDSGYLAAVIACEAAARTYLAARRTAETEAA